MDNLYITFLKNEANRPLKKTMWCHSSEWAIVINLVFVLAIVIKALL